MTDLNLKMLRSNSNWYDIKEDEIHKSRNICRPYHITSGFNALNTHVGSVDVSLVRYCKPTELLSEFSFKEIT